MSDALQDFNKQVGQKKERNDESIGHVSGRRIIKLLERKTSDSVGDDLAHMRKVIKNRRMKSRKRPGATL